jgi:hypothetical protein
MPHKPGYLLAENMAGLALSLAACLRVWSPWGPNYSPRRPTLAVLLTNLNRKFETTPHRRSVFISSVHSWANKPRQDSSRRPQ